MSIYLDYILLIVITFVVVLILRLILVKFFDLVIKKNSKDLKADPTNFIFLKNSISILLYTIGIFWIFHKIPYFNSLGNALFAGAGVLAAVIGFASQKAFANIIGGLFILIFKPFRVHDTIEISNNRRGTVEEITLRHTVIKDYEHKRIIIPNSQISEETIINSSITDDKIRKQIEIEIAYTVDIDKASAIIIEEISKSQFMIDNRTPEDIENGLPLVAINVLKLGVYSITLRANAWTNNANDAFALQCEVYKSIKERFDSENIEIPYPYNNVILKK